MKAEFRPDRSAFAAILKGTAPGVDTAGMIRRSTRAARARAGDGHGSAVTTGRQRLNGRLWTITHRAARAQRDSQNLSNAVRAGAV